MTDGDYLWCAVNLLLDDEETLAQLCPACRERAMEARCPVCGAPTGGDQAGENPAFDQERFEQLRRGVITGPIGSPGSWRSWRRRKTRERTWT